MGVLFCKDSAERKVSSFFGKAECWALDTSDFVGLVDPHM